MQAERELEREKQIYWTTLCYQGTFGGVMVNKLNYQTYTSEFESHWVPHSFGLVPQRSKELRKLQKQIYC